MASGSDQQSVYVLQRLSIVAGNDFRSADPGVDQNTGRREVSFTLTNEAGDRFYDYTSKNVNHSMAIVMNDQIKSVPTSRARSATQGGSRQLLAG